MGTVFVLFWLIVGYLHFSTIDFRYFRFWPFDRLIFIGFRIFSLFVLLWIYAGNHDLVTSRGDVGFARTEVWLKWQCDKCSGILTDRNMRWNLCFPEWVVQKYFDGFPGSRGTGMRGPLTPQLDDKKNWDFKSPSLILLPRLMARSSGATPGAGVAPSWGCSELGTRIHQKKCTYIC